MKICYNYSKSYKLDIDWFSRNIEYLLNGKDTGASYSIYAGLSVNTLPGSECFIGNMKMSICHSPRLSDTGFLIRIDALSQLFRITENPRFLKLEEVKESFNIRLGSALFVIFLWKGDIGQEKIDIVNDLFAHLFRHKELNASNIVTIERCTEAMTCHMSNIVLGDLAIEISDSANGMMGTDKFAGAMQKVFGDGWNNHVKEVRERHEKRKLQMKERKKKKKHNNKDIY